MSKIKFIYMKNIYVMKCTQKNLSIQDLLSKYSSIININFDELLFFYKGTNLVLNYTKKVNEIKDNNIIIFVYNLKIKKINKNNKELKDIICPECNNLAIIEEFNKNKISLNCLKNKHKFIDISLNCFNDSQYIDESLINCQKCENNKNYYNNFYICSNNKYICPLCLEGNEYIRIDYENRFKCCINHSHNYLSYCNDCNVNLCMTCENEHNNHKISLFKNGIKSVENGIKEMENNKMRLSEYKGKLKIINEHYNYFMNELMNDIDIYIKIYKNIINNINNLDNYERIINILNIKSTLISYINELTKEKNIIKNIKKNIKKNIINIYENKNNNENNEMNIIYKINKNEEKIKLFGSKFINNNKQNCILFINDKKCDICEYYYINKEESKKI